MFTLSLSDNQYPPQLREVHRPPKTLYGRGTIDALNHPFAVAIVGTRTPTVYGEETAKKITTMLAHSGIPVVSGLALGIDAIVHTAALDAGGITIGVLGSGVNEENITPRSNVNLGERIVHERGALISEHPPGTTPPPGAFPMRNRIIAGLTRAIIVIEAAAKSGALITARLGLESGRDIFAVPGPITSPLSRGTNNLIQKGAYILTSADDILQFYGITSQKIVPKTTHQGIQKDIIDCIIKGINTADDIAFTLKISIREVLIAVSLLELDGYLISEGGRYREA